MNYRIEKDDYFKQNKIFSIWLQKKKHKKFEDLPTKKAKKYFEKFRRRWNKNKLDPIFYEPDNLIQQFGVATQTQHDWNFKLGAGDEFKVQQCRNSIKKDTLSTQEIPKNQNSIKGPRMPTQGQLTNLQDLQLKNELEYEKREKERQYEKKQWKKQQMEELDELLPKKVGKEAILEQKRLLNKKINGSKDESGLDEFKESDLFGDDPLSSFKRAKNYEEKRKNKFLEKQEIRKKEQKEKFSNYQQKENEKLAFLSSLKHLNQLKK